MKNMKFWRTALVATLVLTVMLSVTGGTIAWFTDSVTSGENIIASGTLDVELYYKDTKSGMTDWEDASEATIFNYDKWEPGYTDVKYVKVKNAGSLAFDFRLILYPTLERVEGVANLADVIEVYMGKDEAPTTTAQLHDMTPVGTITSLAAETDGAAHGTMLANTEEVRWIALHMQETAGNDYQGLSVGEGFKLKLDAIQATVESDSFGQDYDEKAGFPSYDAMYNGIGYPTLKDAIDAANKHGGGVITLNISHRINEELKIESDITINGNGYTVSRADGFTGTVFSVVAGNNTLTMEDVTVDGGAVWTGEEDATLGRGTINSGVTATGNLIATENNASIVLNKGAVLQNNVGAYAVYLGNRIGATLTLNGGEIINNSSEAGAIWGGGNITVNSGKINNNSSTDIAGAIRMVGKCDLTMNGGEICNNKAASDGGAIWGYGVIGNTSTYNFNGGKMSNNESAGTGGAIYTGTYSVINISGDFKMCDNKAANSGAIRLTDHTSMTMTGGTIAGNTQNGESNAFNTWNNSISITGGSISDNFSYVGGLGLTIGVAEIDGVISYNLSTTHNTAYLAADFSAFEFTVNAEATNFANFNFKPANGYTYNEGDEAKLECLNEGYSTYWDATTGTFRLKAE